MTKVRITETPVQVFPFGVQDRISVVNNGPATVYLDGDASINIANAYPLPPTGTMTWRADAPLFARTESGGAFLTYNRHANMSDSSRAQFINLLLTDQVLPLAFNNLKAFESFETGSCETLLVRGYTSSVPTNTQTLAWVFQWYDAAGNPLLDEAIHMVTAGPDTFCIDVPVKGTLCRVYVRNLSFSDTWEANKVQFFGTSRKLPCRSYYANKPLVNTTDGQTTFGRGWARITTWNFTKATALPAWGSDLYLTLSSTNVTTGGTLVVYMMDNSFATPLDRIPFSTGANLFLKVNVTVPTGATPLVVVQEASMNPATLTMIWKDYD